VVEPLEISVLAGIVTGELVDHGCLVVHEPANASIVEFTTVATQEDPGRPDPREVLVLGEVMDAEPISRIDERHDLFGLDEVLLEWWTYGQAATSGETKRWAVIIAPNRPEEPPDESPRDTRAPQRREPEIVRAGGPCDGQPSGVEWLELILLRD
jgi:hypothetical protein